MVTCRSVRDNIHSLQTIFVMGTNWYPNLFTDFATDRCIQALYYSMTKFNRVLAFNIPNALRQLKVNKPIEAPRMKPSSLSVIVLFCHV